MHAFSGRWWFLLVDRSSHCAWLGLAFAACTDQTALLLGHAHTGEDGIELTLTRRLVRVPDVKLTSFLGPPADAIGYIQLSSFSQVTTHTRGERAGLSFCAGHGSGKRWRTRLTTTTPSNANGTTHTHRTPPSKCGYPSTSSAPTRPTSSSKDSSSTCEGTRGGS